MELRIVPYQIPEKIEFNYEEIIQEMEPTVNEKASIYYSDEDISVAKKDRAKFNAFKKAINDEKIRMKKEYMKPFEEFEAKVKDINALADKAVIAIDKQIKEYEDNQKREKLDKIKALWTQMSVPEGLTMEKVYEERMLNTSFSMKKVETCFELAIGKFNRDMATLAALPEFGLFLLSTSIRRLLRGREWHRSRDRRLNMRQNRQEEKQRKRLISCMKKQRKQP